MARAGIPECSGSLSFLYSFPPGSPADSVAFHGGLPICLTKRELCLLIPVLPKLGDGERGIGVVRLVRNILRMYFLRTVQGTHRQASLSRGTLASSLKVLRTFRTSQMPKYHCSLAPQTVGQNRKRSHTASCEQLGAAGKARNVGAGKPGGKGVNAG